MSLLSRLLGQPAKTRPRNNRKLTYGRYKAAIDAGYNPVLENRRTELRSKIKRWERQLSRATTPEGKRTAEEQIENLEWKLYATGARPENLIKKYSLA